MFGLAAAAGAIGPLLAQQSQHKANLAMYNAIGIENLTKAQAYLAVNHPKPSRPCQYCGRTNQKHDHTSCDGCGAPR